MYQPHRNTVFRQILYNMKLTVPDSLADISVKQYKLLANLKLDEKSTEWIVEAICIMCNLSKEETNQLTIPEMERISTIISRINDADGQDEKLLTKLDYKGKRYGFHPNLSKLTVGEFADLETYCSQGLFDNLGYIISILYRPIKTESGDFYSIESYKGDGDPTYWDELKMDVVMGAINFFLSIGVILTKDLANSLAEGEKVI